MFPHEPPSLERRGIEQTWLASRPAKPASGGMCVRTDQRSCGGGSERTRPTDQRPMPEVGVEPTRPEGHRILSPARLCAGETVFPHEPLLHRAAAHSHGSPPGRQSRPPPAFACARISADAAGGGRTHTSRRTQDLESCASLRGGNRVPPRPLLHRAAAHSHGSPPGRQSRPPAAFACARISAACRRWGSNPHVPKDTGF